MIYQDIKHLVGVPWEYLKNDCWVIFKKASKVLGREIHDLNLPDELSFVMNMVVFHDEMRSERWVRVDNPVEGCAVVFFDRKDRPVHIGFALDEKTVLHSMGTTSAVSSSSCDKIDSLIKRGFYKRYEVYDYNM